MAAVFDKATKIERRVADPGTDDTLAAPGALTWMTITTPVALATCIGIDAKLVHGDRWQQIEGNVTVNIFKNNTITIFQNETYFVLQNRTTNIVGNYTKIIIGVYNHTVINSHIQLNVAVRNETYIGVNLIVHVASEQKQDASNWFNFEPLKVEIGISWTELVGSKNEVFGVQLALKGATAEFGVARTGGFIIDNDAEAIENRLQALENKVGALQNEVQAIQPSLSVTMVHAVSVTVKMLVIGVNQYI